MTSSTLDGATRCAEDAAAAPDSPWASDGARVEDLRRDIEFSEYVSTRQRALLRAAYSMTGDAKSAEDLLQSALCTAYRNWSRIRDLSAVDAYVRRAMVNQNISWWRQRRGRPELVTAELPEPRQQATAPDPLADREMLFSLVRTLPPRQRAAVALRFFEDMSEVEVARALSCSVGTVKSNTSRGLAKLRELIAAEVAA